MPNDVIIIGDSKVKAEILNINSHSLLLVKDSGSPKVEVSKKTNQAEIYSKGTLYNLPATYILPKASSTVLGGVKQGYGIEIIDGYISVGYHDIVWAQITDPPNMALLHAHTNLPVLEGIADWSGITEGYILARDGANTAWVAASSVAYASVTDGTNSTTANGNPFKLRSASNKLSIVVANDDVTHGDNALFTVNEANIDHNTLLNYEANEHFLQTAIDHVDVSLPTGILKVTTATGALSVVTDNSATWDALVSFPGFGTTHALAAYGDHTHDLTGPITSIGLATSVASQTGTGSTFVMDTSPVLVTPNIGVAAATSLNATSTVTGSVLISTVITGTAPFTVTSTTPVANLSIGGNASTVTTNANLTGPITSIGNATSVASQTGTGSTFVMSVSPTFTGTVSGIDKSMVGLGNVDNTSDANKPVSTATQTALNLKANLASPTFTGTVTAASLKVSDITTGYVPYQTATVFSESPIFTDGTKVGVGITDLQQKFDVNGAIRIRRAGFTDTYLDIIVGDVAVTFTGADSDGYVRYYFNSNGSTKVTIDGNTGYVGIGTSSPGAKLDLRDGAFILTDTDVAHGMTAFGVPTAAYGQLNPTSTINGGLSVFGLTDADAEALSLYGIIGADPIDATPAVKFRAGKANTTTWQALASTETAFQFTNYTTNLVTILGSGNTGFGFITPLAKVCINGGLHVGGDSAVSDNNILADGTITGTQLISNIATGSAPLTVTSTTKVDNLHVARATLSDTITVAASASTTGSVAFFESATGNLAIKTDPGLTYNATTNVLTVGSLSAGDLTATGLTTTATLKITGTTPTVGYSWKCTNVDGSGAWQAVTTGYKGTWNADTNSPTLADGAGTAGDWWRVTTGATRDLGSGNITFAAGDDAYYNGSEWQLVPNSVASAHTLTDANNTISGKTAGQFIIVQTATTYDFKALSGDATLASTGAMTLATVNSNIGTYGDADSVGQFTVNAKGLITSAANVDIVIAESQVTGLVTDLSDLDALISGKLALTGGTLTGKLITVASAIGGAGINIPHGTAPTSPVDGDMWTTTSSAFVQINTATKEFMFVGAAPTSHVHGNISNDGLIGTIANLPIITGTGGILQEGSFGDAANTFCEGNDIRLSDPREPNSHTIEEHTATVTSGQFLKGTGVNTFGWAAHGLTYSDVGAAASSHTLDSHSNVTITANASGEILKWNGTAWINNTLAEAGIQPLHANLTSAAALAYASASFVKMTGANTFTLDTNTYQIVGAAPTGHLLDSHGNVTITANTNGELLKWNGTAWINNTLSEAGIQAALTFGIANTNAVKINSPDVAAGRYAIFTSSGLDGLTGTEVLADIRAAAENQTFYLGTTQIAINRASGELVLTGVDIEGYSVGLKSIDTTGKITITGPSAGSVREKTVRDADDTILELGGSYTPTGTWNWGTASVTWPTFNQNTLGSAATLTTGRTIGMTGDVSWTSAAFNGSGNVTGTSTIGANKVTLGMMAQVNTATFLGRTTASAGNVEVLSMAQAKTLLGLGTAAYTATTDYVTITGEETISGLKTFSAPLSIGSVLAGFSGVYALAISHANGGIILDRTGANESFIRMTTDNAGGGQLRGLIAGGIYIADTLGTTPYMTINSTGAEINGTSKLLKVNGTVNATTAYQLNGVDISTIYATINANIRAVTANPTIVSADNNILFHCSGTWTFTLPNSLATGFQFTIVNVGTGTITISATGTLYSKGSYTKLIGTDTLATAYHQGSNVWRIHGDLEP